MELKIQINTNTLIIGDFNTPYSLIDKSSGGKNRNLKINNILHETDLKESREYSKQVPESIHSQ